MHEKSKGLEAFDQYTQDAAQENELRQVLQQIRDQDVRAVQQLQQRLARVIG
jgi:hypothetical protein